MNPTPVKRGPLWFSPASIYNISSLRQGGSTGPREPGNQCSAGATTGNSRSQEFAHRRWKIITSKSILSSLNLLGDKSGAEQMLYLAEKWFTKYSVPRATQNALGCSECWLFFFFLISQTRPLLFSCYRSSADPTAVNDKFSISFNQGLGLLKAIFYQYLKYFLDSHI